MHTAKKVTLALVALLTLSSIAYAAVSNIWTETVPGGVLSRTWVGGFNTPDRRLVATTLTPDLPASLYNNPSGDHTVGMAMNAIPDSGGICLTTTDPGAFGTDYTWEGWMYTGDVNTRRGLIVRADPTADFTNCYRFVLESGGFTIRFARLNNQTPTTLKQWFSTDIGWPGAIPANTWIHMKVVCQGADFTCFMSGPSGEVPMPGGTITDASPLLSGWPGCYNFRFDLGLVPVYFDDLALSADAATPAQPTTFGGLKAKYRY